MRSDTFPHDHLQMQIAIWVPWNSPHQENGKGTKYH